jgi:hypothetical protein
MLTSRNLAKKILSNKNAFASSLIINNNSKFSTSNVSSHQSGTEDLASRLEKYQELKKLKQRPLYLDAQATSQVDPRVLDAMLPYLTNMYGNPHSRTHAYGWESEKAVEEAREVWLYRIKKSFDLIISYDFYFLKAYCQTNKRRL